MGGKRGERSTGGGRPQERPAAQREEEEWEQLLGERRAPAQPSSSIMRRPVELPPMVNIKDGEVPPDA